LKNACYQGRIAQNAGAAGIDTTDMKDSPSRPRVALVLLDGGLRHGIANAAHELIRHGLKDYDFVVISTRLVEELQPLVEFIRIPAPAGPYRLRWLMFYVLAGLRAAFLHADLVHTMAPAPLLPNKVDLATVLFSQVAYYQVEGAVAGRWTRLARAFATWLENRAYRPGRARMLSALAPGGKRELQRDHPGLPVIVTPHVLQGERFYPDAQTRAEVRRELGARSGEVVACFVNNTYWELKGLAIAIASLAQAAESVPELGALWVIGSGPVEKFGAIAREYGVAERVHFLGLRTDIERIYRGADVLVHPATYETFSLAVHEAAASGLPVIATRCNGVEDLLADGQAGFMVERNVNAVTEALIGLCRDPGLRARMGRVGRERALAFGPGGFARAVTEAYGQLLDR
jgi:glycosyltransferase involved in cell wall biosynthesis